MTDGSTSFRIVGPANEEVNGHVKEICKFDELLNGRFPLHVLVMLSCPVGDAKQFGNLLLRYAAFLSKLSEPFAERRQFFSTP